MTIKARLAYQLTGICPRYVRPPPVVAARCTHLPVELLAMVVDTIQRPVTTAGRTTSTPCFGGLQRRSDAAMMASGESSR